MSKLSNILNGWQNFIEKSEVTENLAKERAEKCADCPMNKKGILTTLIGDKLTEVQGRYCSECMCPLSAKIRSENETCPINKW